MLYFNTKIKQKLKCLVGVGKTSHTTHDTKDIVVSGVDTDLSSFTASNSGKKQRAE